MQIYFRHQLRHSSPVLARGVPRLRALIVFFNSFYHICDHLACVGSWVGESCSLHKKLGHSLGACKCICVFVYLYLCICSWGAFQLGQIPFENLWTKGKGKAFVGTTLVFASCSFFGLTRRATTCQTQTVSEMESRIENWTWISNFKYWKVKSQTLEIHKCNLRPFL